MRSAAECVRQIDSVSGSGSDSVINHTANLTVIGLSLGTEESEPPRPWVLSVPWSVQQVIASEKW